MSSQAARELLKMGFSEADHARMSTLSAKAQDASLSEAEQEELDGYINVSHLLALLQSKARLAIKKGGPDVSAT